MKALTSSTPQINHMHRMIPVTYGAVLFGWGFVCTWFGQALVARMLKRYGHESFIVLSIAAVMCISTAATGFQVSEGVGIVG